VVKRLAFRTHRHLRLSLLLVLVSTVAGGLLASPAALAKHGVPTPAHIVVVIEENHSYNPRDAQRDTNL